MLPRAEIEAIRLRMAKLRDLIERHLRGEPVVPDQLLDAAAGCQADMTRVIQEYEELAWKLEEGGSVN